MEDEDLLIVAKPAGRKSRLLVESILKTATATARWLQDFRCRRPIATVGELCSIRCLVAPSAVFCLRSAYGPSQKLRRRFARPSPTVGLCHTPCIVWIVIPAVPWCWPRRRVVLAAWELLAQKTPLAVLLCKKHATTNSSDRVLTLRLSFGSPLSTLVLAELCERESLAA